MVSRGDQSRKIALSSPLFVSFFFFRLLLLRRCSIKNESFWRKIFIRTRISWKLAGNVVSYFFFIVIPSEKVRMALIWIEERYNKRASKTYFLKHQFLKIEANTKWCDLTSITRNWATDTFVFWLLKLALPYILKLNIYFNQIPPIWIKKSISSNLSPNSRTEIKTQQKGSHFSISGFMIYNLIKIHFNRTFPNLNLFFQNNCEFSN